MAKYGVWYDDEESVFLLDANGSKLSHPQALLLARQKIETMSKEDIVTALMDRLDINDLIVNLTDQTGVFLPGVLGE